MLTGQWRHSLGVHPLLRKILDPPLPRLYAKSSYGFETLCDPRRIVSLQITFDILNFDLASCEKREISCDWNTRASIIHWSAQSTKTSRSTNLGPVATESITATQTASTNSKLRIDSIKSQASSGMVSSLGLDCIFAFMNKTTMIPCRRVSERELAGYWKVWNSCFTMLRTLPLS